MSVYRPLALPAAEALAWDDLSVAERLDEIDRLLAGGPFANTPEERHAQRFEALERCRAYLAQHPRSRSMRAHERGLVEAINARPGRFPTLDSREER